MASSVPVDDPRLETAIDAAERAAALQRERFGDHGGVEVEYKAPRDLVTAVDREAEDRIAALIEDRHPGDAVLGEEAGARGDPDAEFRWIVDPVDGTTNYAHGVPTFAVSIGIERGGRREIGVVQHTPADDTYAAVRDGGAYLNGAPIAVTETSSLGESLIGTGVSADAAPDGPPFRAFARLTRSTHGFRRLGSAAVDLAAVAAGRFDGCYHHGVSDWDVAAGALLVEEAGGRTADRREDLGAFVVSNGHIHRALLDLVTDGG